MERKNLKRWTNIYRLSSSSLKFLLDYNVTRQNVQRSLHSSMFLLEYQESARIRSAEHVCTREVYTHTHKYAHKRARIRIEDSLLSGQRSPESLFPRDLSPPPPTSPIPFSPAVYFHGKRHGNPWERQWKGKSWDEHPTLTYSQWKRGNIAIRSFLPFNQNIRIILSSRKSFKVSKDLRCRFSWQNGKIKFKERKEGTNDNPSQKFASHRR